MISKEEYKKAQETVKKYEQEQLDIPVVVKRYKCYICSDSGWIEGRRIGYDSIMERCGCS